MKNTITIALLASIPPVWGWSSAWSPTPVLGGFGEQEIFQEESPDRLDELLTEEQQKKCGLAQLQSEERENIALILDDLLGEIASQERLRAIELEDEEAARVLGWRPANEELESRGYKKLQAAIVQANSKDYFVVRRMFTTHATEDIPITFPSILFQEGLYWCDEEIFGGISSILYRGREYRFLFADWETL